MGGWTTSLLLLWLMEPELLVCPQLLSDLCALTSISSLKLHSLENFQGLMCGSWMVSNQGFLHSCLLEELSSVPGLVCVQYQA